MLGGFSSAMRSLSSSNEYRPSSMALRSRTRRTTFGSERSSLTRPSFGRHAPPPYRENRGRSHAQRRRRRTCGKELSLSPSSFLARSTMDAKNRREFLRRTGALGIAGAAALGYPLVETRAAGSAPLLPPRDVIAAGEGGVTLKIGLLSTASQGVYASASQSQQNRLGSRGRASDEKELAHQVRDRQGRRCQHARNR